MFLSSTRHATKVEAATLVAARPFWQDQNIPGSETFMTETQDRYSHDDEALEAAVRKTAYFLWEQDGCPHGRHEEYYLRALAMHRRERTYDGWLEDGPAGD